VKALEEFNDYTPSSQMDIEIKKFNQTTEF
jgi:hypothetical protein